MKIRTIIQPLQFHELFDAQVNQAIEDGWGFQDYAVSAIETKEGTLIAHLVKYPEENE